MGILKRLFSKGCGIQFVVGHGSMAICGKDKWGDSIMLCPSCEKRKKL